ncbi:MAG: hypothetical protein ACTSYL_01815 [Candidatus Thorarchaeota archaeon]
MPEETYIERIETLHYLISQIQLLNEKSNELKSRLERLEQHLASPSANDSSEQSSISHSSVSETLKIIVELEHAITELEHRIASLRKY